MLYISKIPHIIIYGIDLDVFCLVLGAMRWRGLKCSTHDLRLTTYGEKIRVNNAVLRVNRRARVSKDG